MACPSISSNGAESRIERVSGPLDCSNGYRRAIGLYGGQGAHVPLIRIKQNGFTAEFLATSQHRSTPTPYRSGHGERVYAPAYRTVGPCQSRKPRHLSGGAICVD